MTAKKPTPMKKKPIIPEPKYVFILSGGIGAGKTQIVNRLKTDFHFVSGSPADVMKESLARHIAAQFNDWETDDGWEPFYQQMLDQKTKAEYRLLLQGYGEFFSNRDKSYWADQCVAVADEAYKTLAQAGIESGIVFDSIRRDSEVMAVKNRWPNAIHIRLLVEHDRQMDYLTEVLGYDVEKASVTLSHSSEHWLDDMDGKPWDAQYVIDTNGGDKLTWVQLMGIVTLVLSDGKVTLEEVKKDA
jgi:hypothetical protein